MELKKITWVGERDAEYKILYRAVTTIFGQNFSCIDYSARQLLYSNNNILFYTYLCILIKVRYGLCYLWRCFMFLKLWSFIPAVKAVETSVTMGVYIYTYILVLYTYTGFKLLLTQCQLHPFVCLPQTKHVWTSIITSIYALASTLVTFSQDYSLPL